MKKLTRNITYNNDSANTGEIYRLTLCGVDNEEVTLELNEKQCALIESRITRSFYVRCAKGKILSEIDNASNSAALEDIAKKYYLCDACSFDGINLYGVKRLLKVVVEALYKYPKLRSKLCFIGTHYAMESLLVKMEQGDKEILNGFNLQYICSTENAEKLGRIVHSILTKMIDEHEGYVATAMCAFGLLDAVLFDKNDYEGYAYLEFISELRRNEAIGFHPKGCHTPESVIYHELGHLLDDMCGLSENADFKAYYGTLTTEDIKYGLSEYACTSPKEFIAEAFAECMCNPKVRPIATRVGELLNKVYIACS